MRYPYILLAVLAVLLVADQRACGQTTVSSTQNLFNCKHGYAGCDRSRLTSAESAEVAAAERDRNVFNCKHGYAGCERSRLTESEASEVAVAERERNVFNCKHGYAGCDQTRLTKNESDQVATAERERNVFNCKHGYAGCERSRLTESEASEVAVAERERNVFNCKHGYAGCDRTRLTQDESAEVATAERERNVFNCNHGYAGCDRNRLTQSEASEVAVAERERNVFNCKHSYAGCDRARLTQGESAEVSTAERERNVFNCNHGYAGCDERQLQANPSAGADKPDTVSDSTADMEEAADSTAALSLPRTLGNIGLLQYRNLAWGAAARTVQKELHKAGFIVVDTTQYGDGVFQAKPIHGRPVVLRAGMARGGLQKVNLEIFTAEFDAAIVFDSLKTDLSVRYGAPMDTLTADKATEQAGELTPQLIWGGPRHGSATELSLEVTARHTVSLSYEGPLWAAEADRREKKR